MFELDEELDDDVGASDVIDEKIERLDSALSKLVDQVANLANKLDEHLKEPDSHNPAMMSKKQSL